MSRIDLRPRRAIAMLLVLISLVTATILTVAYLASRDNSAMIGENVAAAAAARWAASAGLDVGIAVLQTEVDWRSAHTNGKLIDDYLLDGVSIDLDLTDLETGNPPTESTQYIEIRATATADGVEQTATATAEVPPPEGDPLPLDLAEFAVFATEKITLENDAIVTRWPTAPLTALGKPVSLGTHATGASAVEFKNDAAAIDTTVYTPPGASNSLILNASGPAVGTVALSDPVPVPAEPDPGVDWPEVGDFYPDNHRNGGYVAVEDADIRVAQVVLENGAISHWIGDVNVVANHDMHIKSHASIVVEGDATLICFEDLRISGGSIQVLDDSTLTIFVLDDLVLDDGYIGDGPYNFATDRDNTGDARYMQPSQIQIYGIDEPDRNSEWSFGHTSVAKASIYAPSTDRIEIKDTSALYGRVLTQHLKVKDHGALFYDHVLDPGNGYTDPDSPIYDTDGNIEDAFLLLASLDDADIQALADSLGLPIAIGNSIKAPVGGNTDPPATVPGEATPRPVEVSYQIESFGLDLQTVETAAVDAHNAATLPAVGG